MDGKEEVNLIILLLLGSGGMLLLVLAVVLFVFIYQRKLLAQKISLQMLEKDHQQALLLTSIEMMENERRRIAKDLHDEIGASLTALKIYTGHIQNSQTTEEMAQINQQSRNLIEQTIQNVRTITRDLLPATLEHFGLIVAIQETCDLLNTHIKIDFQTHLPETRLPSNIELAVYRIVRELLNNTYKYAQASFIQIKIDYNADNQLLTIFYSDNGQGFDFQGFMNPDTKLGLGIKSIETRVKALDGKIDLVSKLGEGMKVEIEIKINPLASSS